MAGPEHNQAPIIICAHLHKHKNSRIAICHHAIQVSSKRAPNDATEEVNPSPFVSCVSPCPVVVLIVKSP